MREIADGVHQIPLVPRSGINAYVVGDVLVDAGLSASGKKILAAIEDAGLDIRTHVLTHAHPDHAGGTARISEALDVPVLCGAADREAVETGEPPLPPGVDRRGLRTIGGFIAGFGGCPVDGTLAEGDAIGHGFVVLETPGHSVGHVSFWREADGVLLCGDVVNAMSLYTSRPGLHEPPPRFSPDPPANRASIRRLAALRPRVLGAGHGPVMTDVADDLAAFAAGLRAD